MKACLLIGSASVDPEIFQLINVMNKNQCKTTKIDFKTKFHEHIPHLNTKNLARFGYYSPGNFSSAKK